MMHASRRELLARQVLALDGLDLANAPDVPLLVAAELRAKERVDQFFRNLHADDPPAERQHVHVVMFDALARGVCIVADGGTDAGDLVRGDTRADPTATD